MAGVGPIFPKRDIPEPNNVSGVKPTLRHRLGDFVARILLKRIDSSNHTFKAVPSNDPEVAKLAGEFLLVGEEEAAARLKEVEEQLQSLGKTTEDPRAALHQLAEIKDAGETLERIVVPRHSELSDQKDLLSAQIASLKELHGEHRLAFYRDMVRNKNYQVPAQIEDRPAAERMVQEMEKNILGLMDYMYLDAKVDDFTAQSCRRKMALWADQANTVRTMIASLSPSQEKPVPEQVVAVPVAEAAGIKNVTNSCYMNASLQALFSSPAVIKRIMELKNEPMPRDGNKDDVAKYYVGQAVVNFYDVYTSKNSRHIENAAKDLRQAIFTSNLNQEFSRLKDLTNQQDAEALMQVIMPALGLQFVECSLSSGETFQKNILPVPIPDFPYEKSLSSALDIYFGDEGTTELGAPIKQQLIEPPDILPVQIMRYDARGNKRHDPLQIDNVLTLSTPFAEGESYQYAPVSFVVHLGKSQGSGHYIAYAKRGQEWYKCDDSTITKVNDAVMEEAKKRAYIVMLERVK